MKGISNQNRLFWRRGLIGSVVAVDVAVACVVLRVSILAKDPLIVASADGAFVFWLMHIYAVGATLTLVAFKSADSRAVATIGNLAAFVAIAYVALWTVYPL